MLALYQYDNTIHMLQSALYFDCSFYFFFFSKKKKNSHALTV